VLRWGTKGTERHARHNTIERRRQHLGGVKKVEQFMQETTTLQEVNFFKSRVMFLVSQIISFNFIVE
jgi:hypothetical protein